MITMSESQFDLFQRGMATRKGATANYGRRTDGSVPAPRVARRFDKKAHDSKPENIVDKQIKDFLAATGWIVTRNHVGTFVPYRVAKTVPLVINGWDVISINERGMPDRKAERVIPGRPGFVERFQYEVKASGNRPSRAQREWLWKHTRLGELAEWFDAYKDEGFDDKRHSFLTWYWYHFGRHAGDDPGAGL